MKITQISDSVVGAVGGVAIGYVLWLVAISIGDNATAGQWGPLVLLMSVVLGICAGVWGWRLRRRGKQLWAAFAFGLPVLPVVLTLAVLADVYL
jgi:drug/metabolite transporter (DMT)-like permease